MAVFEYPGIGRLSLAVVDRSGQRSVLVDPWDDWFDLTWSSDGREIWFAAVRPCAGTTGSLHAVDLGGRRRVLFEAPAAIDIHDLSPQGMALLTQMQRRAGMRRWAEGGEADSELSWRDYSFPIDLTPNGRTLLFGAVTECSGSEPASAATFLRTLDGSAPVRVAEMAARLRQRSSHDVGGAGAVSSPSIGSQDGRVPHGAPGLGDVRSRFPWTEADQLEGSPDGRLAAVSGADGRILLVPLDGGTPRPLPGGQVR